MRRWMRPAIGGVIGLAVVGVIARRHGGPAGLAHILLPLHQPRLLMLVLILNMIGLLINGVVWTLLARMLGHRLAFRHGLRAYLGAGLAGYVAMGIGQAIGGTAILRRHGMRAPQALLLVLLADVIGFCGLLLYAPVGLLGLTSGTGRLTVPLVGRYGPGGTALLLGVIAGAMIGLLYLLSRAPRLCRPLLRRMANTKHGAVATSPQIRQLLLLVPLCGAAWLMGAIALYAVLGSISSPAAHHPVTVMGDTALAHMLGCLAFFVPQGLGVREGALVALLAQTIGVPIGQSLTSILALRALDPLVKTLLFFASGIRLRQPLAETAAGTPQGLRSLHPSVSAPRS